MGRSDSDATVVRSEAEKRGNSPNDSLKKIEPNRKDSLEKSADRSTSVSAAKTLVTLSASVPENSKGKEPIVTASTQVPSNSLQSIQVVENPPAPKPDGEANVNSAESIVRIEPEPANGAHCSPDIDVRPVAVSQVIRNFNQNCDPPPPRRDRPREPGIPPLRTELDSNTQVIIRKETVTPSRFCDRKPMSSFESLRPPVMPIATNREKEISSNVTTAIPSPEPRPRRRFEKSQSADFDGRVSTVPPRDKLKESPAPAAPLRRKEDTSFKTPVAEIQPKPGLKRPESKVEDENSVSNVIKRFNDKCESGVEVPEIAPKRQSKSFNAKPSYATMDCRSKRNESMTRGYTLSHPEAASGTDGSRRQTSTCSVAYSRRSGGFDTVVRHPKVRSKSQSAADDDFDSADERRSRGNVSNHRVRFDESSFRGRASSSDRAAVSGDDDDLFEKYETLV